MHDVKPFENFRHYNLCKLRKCSKSIPFSDLTKLKQIKLDNSAYKACDVSFLYSLFFGE